MAVHLFDTTNWATQSTTSNPADPYEIGNRFQVTADVDLTGLRWYRGQTNADRKPSALRIWRSSDSANLVTITTIPDNGAVGWQDVQLVDPLPVVTGEVYVVAMDWPSGKDWTYVLRANVADPPAQFNWDDNIRAYHASSYVYPGTTDNTLAWAVDVTIGGPTGGGTGGGGGSTTADLAAWLSSDGDINTHQGDLPWRTDANVSSAKTTIESVNTSVGAGLGVNVTTALGLLSSIVTIVTAIRDLDPVSALSTLLSNLQGASDAAAAALQNLSNHAVDVLNGHAVTGSSTPNFAWVTAGEPVSFTTSTFLSVAADAYLLEITTPANGQALNVFSGVDVYFRAGWWCECIDGVGSERHYVDFRETWLRDGVRRLGGCLIVLQPGTEATITPYTLGPA